LASIANKLLEPQETSITAKRRLQVAECGSVINKTYAHRQKYSGRAIEGLHQDARLNKNRAVLCDNAKNCAKTHWN
jgi:hypothetical protein